MEKVVLSEIDLYSGEIETPKGFEIQRNTIKNKIIQSYATANSISNNSKDYTYLDYKIDYLQPLTWLQDHMRDFFNLDYHKTLVPKLTESGIFFKTYHRTFKFKKLPRLYLCIWR